MKIVDRTGDDFLIRFDFRNDVLAAVRALPGRRFEKKELAWTVPGSSFADVAKFIRDFQFEVTPAAVELGRSLRNRVKVSRAADADLVVEGLGGQLRPFQKAGVQYAMETKRCFIADEMGLGKTVQALATVQALEAYPVVIVCPASLKLNWRREAKRWLPGRKVQILSGTESVRIRRDVVIVNYDILVHHLEQLVKHQFAAVVFDESHYAKNPKARRTMACLKLAESAPVRLALTGTPVLNRPIELVSQLSLLGRVDDLGGFWPFVTRYCGAKQIRIKKKVRLTDDDDSYVTEVPGKTVWDMTGATNLPELNDRLRAICYIRRLKKDVLSELPAKTRALIPVELDNRKQYEKAAADFVAWLEETGASKEEVQSKLMAEKLTRLNALKKLVAQGKLAAVKEWIGSFLESGEKLVMFAHHVEIVEEIAKEFGAPAITGDTPMAKRQEAVDRFQNDPECKLIVLNMQAGGVGLTLTAASNVAFAELGWTPALHAQAEDRTHRIGQEIPVTAWYLLADQSIDTTIYRLLGKKSKIVDGASDGSDVGVGTIFPELVTAFQQGERDEALDGLESEWTSDSEKSPAPEPASQLALDVQIPETETPKISSETTSKKSRKASSTKRAKAKKPVEETVVSADVVAKAMVALYRAQTEDEKAHGTTRHQNGVGFSALDAAFGTSLARQVLAGRSLSMKQLNVARKLVRKYRRQLTEMGVL